MERRGVGCGPVVVYLCVNIIVQNEFYNFEPIWRGQKGSSVRDRGEKRGGGRRG